MSKFLAVTLSYWKVIDKSLGEFRHVSVLLELRRCVIYVFSNMHYRDDIVRIRQKVKSENWCTRKESIQNFPKNKHFLTSGTHIYLSVSGGRKCSFFGKFIVLGFL